MFKVVAIGMAGVGRSRLHEVVKLENVSVVAVCDLVEERARVVAEELSIPHYVTDYRKLLEFDCDVFMSFTGSYARREHVIAAVQAGKPIFTEKPLAANEEDGRAILAAVRAAGVPYQIGYQLRRTTYGQQIRNVLDSGVIGPVRSLYSHRNMPATHGMPDESGHIPWYGRQELSGGVVVDFSSHDLDLLRWYGGPVKEVYGKTLRVRWPQADDDGWALLTYENGAAGCLGGSFTHQFGGSRFGLTGTEGSLFTDMTGQVRVKLWGEDEERDPNSFGPVLDYPEANQFYSFFRALEEGSPPTPDVQDGWNALELALAIQRSSATGQPVALPLE